MGVTVINDSSSWTIKVHYGSKGSKNSHGVPAELAPGERQKEKSGAFAIDETWVISTEVLLGPKKWVEGPKHTINGISSSTDRKWSVTNKHINPFVTPYVEKTTLFMNDGSETQTYNISTSSSSSVSSETLKKICKTHGDKYTLSFGADGKVKGVDVDGKASAEWSSEEKREVEDILKEVHELEQSYSGSVVIPPNYVLYKLTTFGLSEALGYSVEPIAN